MCILPRTPNRDHLDPAAGAARRLTPQQRRQLALDAIAGRPVSRLAEQHAVSRKFVARQVRIACDALDRAFTPPTPGPEPVLFHLPVTKHWIRQLVLSLVLVGHCPLRGVTEILADLFDYPISLGGAHAIVRSAVASARAVNDREDLAAVRVGLHDEIFQAGKPVLVGVDARSTYCYLLSPEARRDADTWGMRLLERAQRGLCPQAVVADFGSGLRAGHRQALPGVPCRGDVFHALYEAGPLARFLEGRAYDAIAAVDKLARQQQRQERRYGRQLPSVTQRLRYARAAEARAIALADDVATLLDWLRRDILAVSGPDHPTRVELLGFVTEELARREPSCPHRITPVRQALENQGPDLLAFAAQLDQDLGALAAEWEVCPGVAREVLQVQAMSERDPRRWPREAQLRQRLGGRYFGLAAAVGKLAAGVVRASSLVENLNGRLRGYFSLRRQLGPEYLDLLRFTLNPRRLARSEHAERVGKSPAELLRGEKHPHWLELLGYRRFRRAG